MDINGSFIKNDESIIYVIILNHSVRYIAIKQPAVENDKCTKTK